MFGDAPLCAILIILEARIHWWFFSLDFFVAAPSSTTLPCVSFELNWTYYLFYPYLNFFSINISHHDHKSKKYFRYHISSWKQGKKLFNVISGRFFNDYGRCVLDRLELLSKNIDYSRCQKSTCGGCLYLGEDVAGRL